MTFSTVLYAFFGGLLPAIIWLYFLLKEDSRCPEPRKMILLAFVCGACMVPLALWAEHGTARSLTGMSLYATWALIEEFLKYAAAAVFIFPQRAVDESPDYVVYMVTIALGFAAAENALFLLQPLSTGDFLMAGITDNMRFIGATLLHVMASAAIGFSLAFSYGAGAAKRLVYAAIGLILAVVLHGAFNALIIFGSGVGAKTLSAFLLVWSAAVIFFALWEILKYIRYQRLPKNTC